LEKLLDISRHEISAFLKGITHLGPIRPEPQRHYSFSRSSADVWQRRDFAAFRDFIAGTLNEADHQEISDWLERLELAQSVEPKSISERGSLFTEFEIALKESEGAAPMPLSAMGFGASQVLPIVIQCVKAEPDSLVIVEQPELHLHPRAQAALGDLFISVALRDVDSRPRFMLETHSEHLILRLMRRMRNTAKGRLPSGVPATSPTNVGVYVVNRDPERVLSQLHCMEISQEGQLLEPWPGGFFEEDFFEQFAD